MAVELTVATFNIRNGRAHDGWNHWWLRRGVTASWARSLDADIVGFQEVFDFQRRFLSGRLPDYAVAGRGRDADGGGEQVPVFVRPPWQIVEVRHHWFSPTPWIAGSVPEQTEVPRMATLVTCRHRSAGIRIVAANVHLDHRSEKNRRMSATQLVDVFGDPSVAGLPVVLLGDFNATPARTKLYDDLEAAGFRRASYGGSSFNGWRHGATNEEGQLDQILVRDGAVETWRDVPPELRWTATARTPSDHWPLLARATLG